jgi:hypothetical protein
LTTDNWALPTLKDFIAYQDPSPIEPAPGISERDTTLNALAIEAFNDLLKKHRKRQSVEKNPLLH